MQCDVGRGASEADTSANPPLRYDKAAASKHIHDLGEIRLRDTTCLGNLFHEQGLTLVRRQLTQCRSCIPTARASIGLTSFISDYKIQKSICQAIADWRRHAVKPETLLLDRISLDISVNPTIMTIS